MTELCNYYFNNAFHPDLIWDDGVLGFWGFGVLGSEGVMGAEEDKGASIYLMLEG